MESDAAEYLEHQGVRIAFRRTVGESGKAGLVWLGGFHSDMLGEKATTLHDSAARAGRSFVRFDYLGHGESDFGQQAAASAGLTGRFTCDGR